MRNGLPVISQELWALGILFFLFRKEKGLMKQNSHKEVAVFSARCIKVLCYPIKGEKGRKLGRMCVCVCTEKSSVRIYYVLESVLGLLTLPPALFPGE